MKTLTILLSIIITGSVSFAGGIYCKQCPAESSFCSPRPDCADGTARAYNCQFEGSNGQFQIVENSPQEGLATIHPVTPGTKPLRFTQSSERHRTRYGIVTVTKKVYFHPFYEFQLFLTSGADYYLPDIENLKGRYISEMNTDKTFRCVERK